MPVLAALWASGSGEVRGEIAFEDRDAGSVKGKRRMARRPVEAGAGLRPRGGSNRVVRLVDLSTHGFRVSSNVALPTGTDVWLRLPGLEPCQARVIWTEAGQIGCAFFRALHPAVFDLLARRNARP